MLKMDNIILIIMMDKKGQNNARHKTTRFNQVDGKIENN